MPPMEMCDTPNSLCEVPWACQVFIYLHFISLTIWRQIGNYTRAGQVNGSDVEKWND